LRIERVIEERGDVWGSGLEYQDEDDEDTVIPPLRGTVLETTDDDDDETISVDDILFDTESQRQRFEPIVAARTRRKVVVN